MKLLYDTNIQNSLKQIQLRAQVALGRTLTHGDLAELAGVGTRSLGDWMRGVTAPIGMGAVFELLSRLPAADVMAVLAEWRARSTKQPLVAPKRALRVAEQVRAASNQTTRAKTRKKPSKRD